LPERYFGTKQMFDRRIELRRNLLFSFFSFK